MRLRRLLVVLLSTFALSVTACGGSGDTTTHSEADLQYVQQVYAMETISAPVGTLLRTRGTDQRVKDLGAAVAKSQDRYAKRANDLLDKWDRSSNDVNADDAANPLKTATGSLDRNGLEVLKERHEAIIALSTTEAAEGESNDAKKLARDLIAARSAEKGQIEALLAES